MLFARAAQFQPLFKFSTIPLKRSPLITKTRLAIGVGLVFSFIGYRQGKNRYNEMHFSQMYETIPDTKVIL